MFNPYADEKYHAFRYGELLEEAARRRLADAAEAERASPFRRLANGFSSALIGFGLRLHSGEVAARGALEASERVSVQWPRPLKNSR
jgi:hypothetical protein